MRRSIAPSLLLAVLLLPVEVFADGDATLGLSGTWSGQGIGVTSEGVGLATRGGEGGDGTGDITIDGVPPGASVVAA